LLDGLVITSEFSSGTIRASVPAVLRRSPILAAKCAVFAGLMFVISEIVCAQRLLDRPCGIIYFFYRKSLLSVSLSG
jgi:hypothetical protein